MISKLKSHRDKKYLQFIREQPCVITGVEGDVVVAHHIRCLGGGGMGLKPTDYLCVPLASYQHHDLHRMGELKYWQGRSLDPEQVAKSCLLAYIKKLEIEGDVQSFSCGQLIEYLRALANDTHQSE